MSFSCDLDSLHAKVLVSKVKSLKRTQTLRDADCVAE